MPQSILIILMSGALLWLTFQWLRSADRTLRQLRSSSPHVRKRAAEKLRVSLDVRAVERLVHLLADANAEVRQAARGALGKIDPTWCVSNASKAAVSSLIYSLANGQRDVAINAAAVLGMIGDAQALEPLILKLQDADANAREAAQEALGQIDAEWRASDAAKAAVPLLIQSLASGQVDVRRNAVTALGIIGDPQATQPLLAMLVDVRDTLVVRHAAVLALGKIRDMRAAQPLLAIAKATAEKDSMRGAAIDALAELQDLEAIKFMREVLTNCYGLEPHDAWTLSAAALVLSAVGATAGWLPARRAARIDPASVLREA